MCSSISQGQWVNSLVPGRLDWNFGGVIFRLILVIIDWGISCEIALRWMSLDLNDDKSTLVQVMAWCRQAPSQYLSQCWPRSMSPYGNTRPQWVNIQKWQWPCRPFLRNTLLIKLILAQRYCMGHFFYCMGHFSIVPEPMLTKIYVTIWHH